MPPTDVLTRSPESAEFAARHHLGLGVSFAPLQTTAEVMTNYRRLCAAYGWEPPADDLVFRTTIMIGETDEEAQEGVSRYWSARALANITPAARAVTGLAGRLHGSSTVSMPQPNTSGATGGSAVSGVNMNFVGNPDMVFRQIKKLS